MVGIISGGNLSQSELGLVGGNSNTGQTRGNVTVDVRGGNALISFVDETLNEQGLSLSHSRTHEVHGFGTLTDTDGDQWNDGARRLAAA